jgi:hypothetical protein
MHIDLSKVLEEPWGTSITGVLNRAEYVIVKEGALTEVGSSKVGIVTIYLIITT